ncbi:MAG: hypothetical protein PHS49_01960 [Candidatus Gracilibacteria bacterium]|nr:hypothetical protein [Candidatus Gracilibacteria bacterium]
MIKNIFITILLLFTFFSSTTFADTSVSTIAQNWFNSYSKKIAIKYSDENEIIFFKGFNDKLNDLLAKKRFNDIQINLINDLIKLSNEYVFNLELKNKEKLSREKIKSINVIQDFKYLSYNPDHIFLENGVWYTYYFTNRFGLKISDNPTINDLKQFNIEKDKTLTHIDENNIWFVKEFKKKKLVSESTIYGISNKYLFLLELKDDLEFIEKDADIIINNLKNESIEISKSKTIEQKIEILYDYVLENIEYPSKYNSDDYENFSGIYTYKNRSGVCEGYTRMLLYMLSFSNVNNTEVLRGDIIDAPDFNKIGHAWIKIGEQYYDPTFDDPIGNTKTKILEEYLYFGLPKDLFYTNRFDFGALPDYLKETDLDFRKNLVSQNIAFLTNKYKNKNYNLLKPYIYKLNNGIDLNKKIDIEDLKKIMGYYEVENLKFTKNGGIVSITGLNYYIIEDNMLKDLLNQLNYELNNFYLFKWKLENGTYEYRLAYDVKLK